MKLLKKITVKSVCGKIDKDKLKKLLELKDGESLPLMRVFGVANKATDTESDLGPYVKFRGQFKGVSMETGESYRSGSCILPATAQELLAGAFTKDVSEVEFAFEIGIHYDETAATQYVYDVESLHEAGQADSVSALEAKLSDVLALPKPPADAVDQNAMAAMLPEPPAGAVDQNIAMAVAAKAHSEKRGGHKKPARV
jgi:hypothetical protein